MSPHFTTTSTLLDFLSLHFHLGLIFNLWRNNIKPHGGNGALVPHCMTILQPHISSWYEIADNQPFSTDLLAVLVDLAAPRQTMTSSKVSQ
jgi:hypothetical protein